MKRPMPSSPARVHQSLATGALTPHEAAVRLTRIEFDTARLEREIALACRRIEKAETQLVRHNRDREILLGIIGREAGTAMTTRAKPNAA